MKHCFFRTMAMTLTLSLAVMVFALANLFLADTRYGLLA